MRRPLTYPPLLSIIVLLLTAGCGTPSFLVTPVSSSTKLLEEEVQPGKGGGKIAIVQVEGMLMNARTGGFLQPGENAVSIFAQQMDKAAKDKNVKAVVLRVNSPGGTVTASDLMYDIVNDFRAESGKPVVAAPQEVAASGGYYVACAADQIVAHPTSVVGSIGVIFSTFEFAELMAKAGVRNQAIKSGPLKDMGSPFKALSDQEREVMQGMVDDYYGRFVEVVRTRRSVTSPDTLKLVTDGACSPARARRAGPGRPQRQPGRRARPRARARQGPGRKGRHLQAPLRVRRVDLRRRARAAPPAMPATARCASSCPAAGTSCPGVSITCGSRACEGARRVGRSKFVVGSR
jgi:protease-4